MDSKMMGLALAGPMMMYAGLVVLVIPFVLYVIARWRAHREQVIDPQLGIKVALGYFATVGLQLVLAGATVFFYALLSSGSSDDKSTLYRFGFGLIMPGGVVLATHLGLLRKTNQDQFPSVKRIMLGYNLFLTGTGGLVALVLAFQALFERGSSGELGRIAGAMVLVYGTAWAITGFMLGRLVLGGYQPTGPGGPPTFGMTPSPPPSAGAPAATPGLPPLRDGAYPPLDQK